MTERDRYDLDMKERAAQAFENHGLHSRRSITYFLRDPRRGFNSCYISSIASHWIAIVGDIESVIIKGSDGDDQPIDHFKWAAEAHVNYLAEKVSLAFGSTDLAYDFNNNVAAADLVDLKKAAPSEHKKAISEAIYKLEHHGKHVLDVLSCDGVDVDASVGRVVAPRIYYAQAALKRLVFELS